MLRGDRLWAVALGDGPEFIGTLPDDCIDLVATDPPYTRSSVGLYESIARRLSRVLKWGGSFLAIVPHRALPQVLSDVNQHLNYRWTLCMWQGAGDHARLKMGIEVMWKPVVWWIKGTWPMSRGFVKDGFENAPLSKRHHRWEQSLSWAQHCVRFVPPGGVVVDPLMGSGTLGVACVREGVRFIGVDRDPGHLATAAQRLAEAAATATGSSSNVVESGR